MKNYQTELDRLISSLESKPSLLLHSCCGPCSSYVTEYLANYFDITLYYFNPCIYPESEYIRRLDTQKRLLDITGLARLDEGEYDHESFLKLVRGFEHQPEGGKRCEICFYQRLVATAKRAAENNFDYFATTLTVSPHKNAELLNSIAEKVGERFGVSHLPSDFKKKEGYKRSVELSKKYNLYRQSYCGCEFSMAREVKNKEECCDGEK